MTKNNREKKECVVFKLGIDQVIVYRVDTLYKSTSEVQLIESVDMIRDHEKESKIAEQILDLSKHRGDKTQYIGIGIPVSWLKMRINRFQMSGVSIFKENLLEPYFKDIKINSIRVETPDYLMEYVEHVLHSIERGEEPVNHCAGILSLEITSENQEYIIQLAFNVDDVKVSEMTLNDLGDSCGEMSSF